MSTLNDVAKTAGVSPVTVSRVINTPSLVRDETLDRVKKAMAELHYIPNVAAKNLVTRRSSVIDVFVPENIDLSNPFVMHLLAGISEELSAHMYSFLILRNRKREHLCDGYIVTGLLKDEIRDFERYAAERNRPVALFGHTDLPDVDCIDVDNIAGGAMAAEHLIAQGHSRIAMINVSENKDYTIDRLAGYRNALKAHGLRADEALVVYGKNSVAGGGEAARQLLAQGGFTAIFCATDTMAIGAAAAIAEAGFKIPGDISLVGFDGLGHQLLVTPRVTSVQQPVYQIGRMLAETLICRLEGGSGQKMSRLVAPILFEGESVAQCN